MPNLIYADRGEKFRRPQYTEKLYSPARNASPPSLTVYKAANSLLIERKLILYKLIYPAKLSCDDFMCELVDILAERDPD